MRTVKTSTRERTTYTYKFADGTKVTVAPGDSFNGVVITEEIIRTIHRMDDNEVYNNVKNAKRPVEDWEKPILEAWQQAHPYDDLPVRGHISIDALSEMAETKDEFDADKSGVMEDYQFAAQSEVSSEVERLREVVEMMKPEQQELYTRIVLNGESMVSIAKEQGVGKTAIEQRPSAAGIFLFITLIFLIPQHRGFDTKSCLHPHPINEGVKRGEGG